MKEFELKLGATTYKCSSNVSDVNHQNWNISGKFHDLNLNMSIPIESKVSLDKVLVFVSSLDEALKKVQHEKAKELTFLNQLT
jgi:hypothetical protein